MATSMRNSVRLLVRRESPRYRCVVSWLDSFPSQLQQRLSNTSDAALDEHSHAKSYAFRALIVPSLVGRSLEEDPHLKPLCRNDGPLITIRSFAVRGIPSGYRFFSSDSSALSTNSSSIFEALGDVDELNSVLGLAHEFCSQAQLTSTLQQIEEIQSRLLDVGSAVAIPLNNPFSNSSKKVARVKFNAATIEVLESWMEKMHKEVPHQTGFILPSGGLPAASLHVARSVCRRAERTMITLVEEEVVDESVVRYLNRLSDYLFTAARFAASKLGKPETEWRINQRR